MTTAALFKPLKIKTISIRNRIMSTAHTSGAGEDGKPKERYQRYHEEKARGGIGLTIIGGSTAVAPDTPGADMLHLDASTDDIIPYYQELADRVHNHGAAVFAQIAHMGRRANWDNDRWLVPISPSRVREPAHRSFPRDMEDWDFRRIATAFAKAAKRVRDGGIDGLELSATHGHLIDQFWSPRINKRQDKYGGSLENRLRFTLEIIDAIRTEVGDDYVLGLRMSADELFDGGLSHDDCLEIAQKLTCDGRLDYLSVLAGQAENLPSHAVIFPGMSMPAAPYLGIASRIKSAIDVPLFHAQRISDTTTAARAIAEGHVDMVAMTRPHLADPHIVKKLSEGRSDDIRPCIGANYCIDRLYSGGQAYCLHNPVTGREMLLAHEPAKASDSLKVVIIGAGVAGLEAARVAALRGHKVILFEKDQKTGGQLHVASKLAWRESLLTISRWLEAQVRKLDVDLRLGQAATVERILEQAPDVIILATGGTPRKLSFPGAELSINSWDILSGAVKPADHVLVYDENGSESALSAAEYIAERGAKVEFVTADDRPGILLERTTRPVFMRNLHDHGTVFITDQKLIEVYPEGNRLVAALANEYNGAEEEHVVDQVVVEHGTDPDTSLYEALKPLSRNLGEVDLEKFAQAGIQAIVHQPENKFRLFRIGDAVASRNVHAAMLDAHRLCQKL